MAGSPEHVTFGDENLGSVSASEMSEAIRNEQGDHRTQLASGDTFLAMM